MILIRYLDRLLPVSLLLLVAACGQVAPATPPFTAVTETSFSSAATPTSERAPTQTPPEGDVGPATAALQPALSPTPTPAALPTQAPTPSPPAAPATFPPAINLEPVLTGFQSPLYVTYASLEEPWASRLFIVERTGRIFQVDGGLIQSTPFLDITDRVSSKGSEQGLLGVAFPPDFATSRRFYVDYTDQAGNTIIARYRLSESAPQQADPTSEQQILQIPQPAANHNGGQLQFGPDGYLYIGMGDGGQAGDPWGNAQNPGVLLGKVLRINVSQADTYTVPASNPGLSWPGARPEIWALGLRNPWRFTFDRVTGDLYIADVGQNTYEEVNFQPGDSPGGENYGWDVMEANHCFEPATNCDPGKLTLPVAEYDHSQGCSITGGYVYRGSRYPQLVGVYFFGDFCSGNIWGLKQEPSGTWTKALLLDTNMNISSFGEDATGEIYVADYREGTIYHLVALP